MKQSILSVQPLGFPWQTDDPFLFCAYHRDEYPSGNTQMKVDPSLLMGRNIGQDFVIKDGFRMYHGSEVPGFPYHPHRGFETITINKEGVVDHSDSLGAAGRFKAGDVQWMTAGKGVQHSEMFPLIHQEAPNPLEIFQIWLNLPKKDKFVAPHFKMLWKEEIPQIIERNGNGKQSIIEVIAGNYNNTVAPKPTPNSWASDPLHAVRVLTVSLDEDATWILPKTGVKANRALYFYNGKSIDIGHERIQVDHRIQLQSDIDITIKNGLEKAQLLVLEGVPIGEPVAQHGPFVMNTRDEILAAFQDFQRTEFGGWPWPMKEMVHSKNKGRFALHANGVEEIKE